MAKVGALALAIVLLASLACAEDYFLGYEFVDFSNSTNNNDTSFLGLGSHSAFFNPYLNCYLTPGMRGIIWQPNPTTTFVPYVYPAEQNVFGSSIICSNTGNILLDVSVSLNDTYPLVTTVASNDNFISSFVILNTTDQLLNKSLAVGGTIKISLYRNYSNLAATVQKNVSMNIDAVPA